MKITIFGAAGDVGSRMVAEALARNHAVTAVIRKASQLKELPQGVIAKVAELQDGTNLNALFNDQDIVISAVRPPQGAEATLVSLTQTLINAARTSGVRILLVGGASSLKMPDQSGHTVLTAPNFLPASVVPIAKACFAQYELCLAETKADWTYLAPSAMLVPGTRTGIYRTGKNHLLTDETGQSRISMEDLAVAMLDEAETPQYKRQRFTAANT